MVIWATCDWVYEFSLFFFKLDFGVGMAETEAGE